MGRTMKFSLALVGLFALVAVTTAYSCNSNTAHTTIKQVITATYAIQASAWATDSTGIKEMSQCAYGKALGIATAASYGCYYTSGCTVSSTAAAGRRSYSLAVTYTAGLTAAQSSAASTAARALTAASFTSQLSSVRSIVTAYASLSLPTVSAVASASVTTVSGAAALSTGIVALAVSALAVVQLRQ